MGEYTFTVHVAAPPETVFALWTDLDRLQDLHTRLRDPAQAFAMAREDVDAELFFQFEDGLAHPGLRCVQGLGGFSQVQATARSLLHETELVQVHGV